MAKKVKYEDFLKIVAVNIKQLRIVCGYTQEDMIQFGFNYRHYQKLESGKHSPSLSTIFRLSNVFKVDVSEIIR
ncbi:MAG: helix-turn-helix transcriptional regulator [Halobacteriovoraceae bacterium]|jgi:DNA-binding XRE family transcriptional regulator|nr:helix-turn-helix transcriptional regulator [Halobacteriovoraceae bacterium]